MFINSKKLLLALLSASLVGCQTLETKKQTVNYDQHISTGNYQEAVATAIKQGKIDATGKSKNLLWSLQAGSALTSSKKYIMANSVLDNAESFMKIEDLESLLDKTGEQATAVLLNNMFNDYDPTVYDGVMVNTYKAVNFFRQHDYQNARIEFNRASERQRLAEEFFKKKIQEQNAKKRKEEGRQNFDKNMNSSMEAVNEQFPELADWEVYPDYVNPYTDYIHSLFFLLTGSSTSDYNKARHSIRRVAGMNPDNKSVKTDLLVINNVAKGKWKTKNLNSAVWIIFENGLSPKVDEILIPIPVFLVTSGLKYMQIALPKLVEREKAYSHLEIYTNKGKKHKTEELASIERVIQSEFKKEYSYRVTQAIMSTVIKAVIQSEMDKRGGIASLAAALYQAGTTRADTRSWTSLPKEYQMVRMRKPSDGKIKITAPGHAGAIDVTLPKGQFSIVHVKATTAQSGLTYDVISL